MTRRTALYISTLTMPWIASAQSGDDAAARKEADRLLAWFDEAKYGDCWKRMTQYYRGQVTQNDWQAQVKQMRDGAGKLTERKLNSTRPSKTLAGAPDGEYMVVEYTSTFANRPKVVETIVLSREGGGWKLAGYAIR